MEQPFSIANILFYFAVILGILPIAIRFGKSRKSFELKTLEPYLWVVCLGGIVEITNSICYSLNMFLFTARNFFFIYTVVEFICLCIYFQGIFEAKYRIFRQTVFSLFLLMLFYFAYNWQSYSISVVTSGISAVQTLLVVLCCTLWLKDRLNEEVQTKISSSAHFFIIIGFLIYYSCTFLLFVFDSYLDYKAVTASVYRWIAIPSAIILRLFLIAGTLKTTETTNRQARI